MTPPSGCLSGSPWCLCFLTVALFCYFLSMLANMSDLTSGSADDWMRGVAKVNLTYTIELRDKGRYGFLLPPSEIEPVSLEFNAAIFELLDGLSEDLCKRKKPKNSITKKRRVVEGPEEVVGTEEGPEEVVSTEEGGEEVVGTEEGGEEVVDIEEEWRRKMKELKMKNYDMKSPSSQNYRRKIQGLRRLETKLQKKLQEQMRVSSELVQKLKQLRKEKEEEEEDEEEKLKSPGVEGGVWSGGHLVEKLSNSVQKLKEMFQKAVLLKKV